MKAIGQFGTYIVGICVAISIGALGLIQIQGQPIWVLIRHVLLAGLGEATPGLTVPTTEYPRLNCDLDSGDCTFEGE